VPFYPTIILNKQKIIRHTYKFRISSQPVRGGIYTTTLFDVPDRQATWADGIDSLESIPGLLKRYLISNGGRFKPAFAEKDQKQTMIDLRGISTNWLKNQLCPSIRLSRLNCKKVSGFSIPSWDVTNQTLPGGD
jgi:hypothetical protein